MNIWRRNVLGDLNFGQAVSGCAGLFPTPMTYTTMKIRDPVTVAMYDLKASETFRQLGKPKLPIKLCSHTLFNFLVKHHRTQLKQLSDLTIDFS